MITGFLVALVGVLGALETLGVTDLFSPEPVLKATLHNIDREVPVSLADYSASTETASVARGGPGGRAVAATTFVLASDVPGTRLGRTLAQVDGDGDGDGVSDSQDNCAGTPAGTSVDSSGCPTGGSDSDDSDNDGVPDAQDNCAGTPAGTSVDSSGCPTGGTSDSDNDGVSNAQDNCADTPAGTSVDSSGCPSGGSDSDNDGVSDAQDDCTGTPAGTSVDSSGCPSAGGSDRDDDGVRDQLDHCPTTSAKNSRSGCHAAQDQIMRASRCSEHEIDKAVDVATGVVQAQRPPCTSLAELAVGLPGGDSKDPVKRSKAILSVLRSTRTRSTGSGKRREPLGVAVSFELTLEGFNGREVEVRWSLYRGGGQVAKAWLKDHPILSLKGEADRDTASPEFWVPLPEKPGRYSVRIEVFDDKGVRLTRRKTKSFH